MVESFLFACPLCRSHLVRTRPLELFCPVDGAFFVQRHGIWHFLPAQLSKALGQFMLEYRTVRSLEGRGATDPEYYRRLPFEDSTGKFSADWEIRARSFQSLIRSVIAPLEKYLGRPLKVLDLGAGNGWLSYRLARRGHLSAAVDLQTNRLDGLGAHIYYNKAFTAIQADFNHLPLQDGQADLVIFNAAFHYSTSYKASLDEALRVLCPQGQVVILDSPIYKKSASGAAMVREREAQFRQRFGFASNAIPSENYLTYERLTELGAAVGLNWQLIDVYYGVRWALRPLRAWIAGRRSPAQFRLIVGPPRDLRSSHDLGWTN
jgi:SAM-dependent methyltransferase